MNYDISKPICLYVDYGLGGMAATVVQGHEDESGKLVSRPVHQSSRVITETEQKNSKVEGESLAVLSGIKTNRM